ncbi:AvrD family protein [Sporolactobacillus sp. CQH2019]|nr:AvrD family protein [Sporolactobacillus sp. CQH2019]MDD9149927.1 AvrD family protein [Sporolactobacillus sp. CQH2019]
MNVKLYFVNLRPTAIVPISTNIFTNYTENHLNNKAHDIKQIEFLSRLQLQALAHIFEDGQKSIFTGLQSNHQYLTSLLDWLVVFAQMGEILAYHYDNLKRDESGNFWMRKIKAKFLTNTLPKIGDNIPVFAEITDTNMIKLNREEWRTFSMAGYNNAKTIVFVAKVAHKLPKKLTRQGGSK